MEEQSTVNLQKKEKAPYNNMTKNERNMSLPFGYKKIILFHIFALICCIGLANESLFKQARTLQREGKYEEAIVAFKDYLSQPILGDDFSKEQMSLYTDALVQLMNSFQSKGEPENCIISLQEVFDSSPVLQDICLRDFYSVLGYALSRTENMKKAEETMLKALTLPLHEATPERYFRDYAYAAAVFYSNPHYHKEVVNWCKEALVQAKSCMNTSGQQWVMSMLGSLYKRSGELDGALDLFQKSIEESKEKGDELGVLNGFTSLVDLFLYWDIPQYADMYASEAIQVEKSMKAENPMVSAQVYINKARTMHQLGYNDSIHIYTDQARLFCESLPYNSGMVDVDLLNGICLTGKGGNSLNSGISSLEQVTRSGTAANRAKAYHCLAQTYLKEDETAKADVMLDSLCFILNHNDSPAHLFHIDYKPILDHYMAQRNHDKVRQFTAIMLAEQQTFEERSLNYNLVEAIVELQTGSRLQDLKIVQLKQSNKRLWLFISIAVSLIVIGAVIQTFIHQRKKYKTRIRHADEQVASLVQKLNQSNLEREKIAQEIQEFLAEKDNRQELETLTPYMLKESETKFRHCFELLYPLLLPRLREKVPSISRREELLSMLIVLKQDNKVSAELLGIAPRSVLMLRHRFRQKIGIASEYSLENFIKDLLN